MVSVRSHVSVEEYMAGDWPPRSQLIDGEVVVNDPMLRHQRAVGAIYRELSTWCLDGPGRGEAGLGCNWVMPIGANVYVPDVWWLADERIPGDDTVWLDGGPDLAVEVRSPGTWRYDIGIKLRTYESAGLPELWLIDPAEHTFRVLRRSRPDAPTFDVEEHWAEGDDARTPLLPGWSRPVAGLFR